MSGIKLVAYRQGGVLRPYGEVAEDDFDRIPQKPKLVTIEVHQPRNPKHLARYWCICKRAAATDPEFSDKEEVDDWIRERLRMFKEFKDYDGRLIVKLDSIGAEAMDQLRFKNFYDRAIWLLSERLGVDPEALIDDRSEAA
jgi:hypothetical protein